MAELFNYSSVLALYMRHLFELKASAGISAHRTKWIMKEFDDFANRESLGDARITENLIKRWRVTRCKGTTISLIRCVLQIRFLTSKHGKWDVSAGHGT